MPVSMAVAPDTAHTVAALLFNLKWLLMVILLAPGFCGFMCHVDSDIIGELVASSVLLCL